MLSRCSVHNETCRRNATSTAIEINVYTYIRPHMDMAVRRDRSMSILSKAYAAVLLHGTMKVPRNDRTVCSVLRELVVLLTHLGYC